MICGEGIIVMDLEDVYVGASGEIQDTVTVPSRLG